MENRTVYNVFLGCLRPRPCPLVCWAATVLLFCGCGPPGVKHWPVSGKVMFRGKPVAAASVRFSNPDTGIDVVAELGADGEYVITGEKAGLPEGTYQIAVVPKVSFDNVKSTPSGLVVPSSMPSMNRPDIPRQYQKPATSGLTMTVKPESNTYDVDMQWPRTRFRIPREKQEQQPETEDD